MAAINKFIGIGNLGRDPETRFTTGGDAIANISIGISESWKDKATGEKKEMTEWVRITFFGRLAEIVGQYLKKGSQVYVEGRLRTRKYTDKDGIERYATEVIADTMQMLGSRQGGGEPSDDSYASRAPAARQNAGGSKPPARAASNLSGIDDDIPF